LSNHVTRRVELRIGQSKRGNYPVASTFRRPQPDKDHLILIVINDAAQGGFQFNLFRGVQVALKHREFKVIAKIAAGLEYLS